MYRIRVVYAQTTRDYYAIDRDTAWELWWILTEEAKLHAKVFNKEGTLLNPEKGAKGM